MARCPTICRITCADIHTEHSAYRRSKKLLITLQTLGNIRPPTALNILHHMPVHLLCPRPSPTSGPHIWLYFSDLLSPIMLILSESLLDISSLHLVIPNSEPLLSFLCESDIASISTHLPHPKNSLILHYLLSQILPLPDLLFPSFTFVPSYSKVWLTFIHTR